MGKDIIANVEPYETRVAVVEGGTLLNIFIERNAPLAGNIYKGRVANVLPGMEAAFVDIGLERNAFLHVADIRSERLAGEEVEESFGRGAIGQRLRVGQEILVQVTKEPMGTKGARVTTYVALPARFLVLMPTVNYVGVSRRIEDDKERKRLRELADRLRPERMGLIVRTAAEGATEKELVDDLRFLLQVWNRVEERSRAGRAPTLVYQDLGVIRRIVRDLFTEDVDRFIIDSPSEFERIQDLLASFAAKLKNRLQLYRDGEPIFEHFGVERELERALRRKVWLKSGGYIIIDRTEAFTVIDVNTGKYVGKTDLASTIFRTNMEAIGEIIRQVTLRDIGGIILIDFIDMENDSHQKRVLQGLNDAVRNDRAKVHVIDLTGLGLVEMTRKRVFQDLEEVMRTPCPYCEGRGRVLSPETISRRVRREIRKMLRSSAARAILIEVHPEVYEDLFHEGSSWLRSLEEGTGKRVRIRPREGMHLEKVAVVEGEHPNGLEQDDTTGARRHLVWFDREPGEAPGIMEPDAEQEMALAVADEQRAGLVGRLWRLLRKG